MNSRVVILEMRARAGRRLAPRLCVLFVTLFFAGWSEASAEDTAKTAGTTFHAQVVPILKRSCLGCHSGRKPKGKYSMESLEKLLAGSERGRTIVPGKPTESLLFLSLIHI